MLREMLKKVQDAEQQHSAIENAVQKALQRSRKVRITFKPEMMLDVKEFLIILANVGPISLGSDILDDNNNCTCTITLTDRFNDFYRKMFFITMSFGINKIEVVD